MAQHDLVIDNAPGIDVRLDMQAALQALVSCSAGPVEPATKYAGMLWLDTSVPPDGILRQRNQSNTAWGAMAFSAQLLPFTTPDMSILGRSSPNRIVINDAVTGAGIDLFAFRDDGTMYQPANAAQPRGTVIETIYSSSSAVWTKQAGLKYIEVEGCAPGGSGSGAAVTTAGVFSFGSGGGAGAWGKKAFLASALPSSLTIVNGSVGAASLGAGSAGGASTFGALITLPGGLAGIQGANTTGAVVPVNPTGTSGAPSGVTIGAPGASGQQSVANMLSGYSQVGGGGLSPYGTAYPTVLSQNVSGTAGLGYGAGGSSAANGASQSARPSGSGAPGFWRVREYY